MRKNHVFLWILKAGVAAIIAVCILCGITFVYNYTGIHITNKSGATDYKWEKSQLKTTMSEGFAWLQMDEDGFNNVEAKPEQVDILLMGSSHMEALEVAKDENTGYLLNKLLPNYSTYNIGMSGHTIYTCVKNVEAAVSEYTPREYVVMETDRVDLSVTDMQKVIDGTYETIPSYDSGLLYTVQKFIPAAKLIYGRLDEWRAVEAQTSKDEDMIEVMASDVVEEEVGYTDTLNTFLAKAKDSTEKQDCELIIFYQPTTELGENGSFKSSTDKEKLEQFSDACNEVGIIFVDMTKPFEELYMSSNKLAHGFINTAVGVGHLNVDGHRVIAETLVQTINNKEAYQNDSE